MVTGIEAADILYAALAGFGIERMRDGALLPGRPRAPRVVLHPKRMEASATWHRCFVECNFVVPDLGEGMADLTALAAWERRARKSLDGCAVHDGTMCRWTVESTSVVELAGLKAHALNARVLFKAMNTLEQDR